MTTWLQQTGSMRAHAYPDDDDATVAACGHELEDDCEQCGRALETYALRTGVKCKGCEAVLAKASLSESKERTGE